MNRSKEVELETRIIQLERNLKRATTWNVEGLIFEQATPYGPFALGGSLAQAGSSSGGHPFKLFREDDFTDPQNPVYQVKLWPGMIDGIVPSNIFAPFPIDLEETHIIGLTGVFNAGRIGSATISLEVNPPLPNAITPTAPTGNVELILGFVVNGQVLQVIYNNIRVVSELVYIEPVAHPVPGELNYTPYYRWEVSESA